MNPAAPESPAHMPQLDSLRALAFFGVAASHWLVFKFEPANVGGTGVQLFFVLSGFLITGILLDYRRLHESSAALSAGSALRTFYVRRILRIFPLFYAAIFGALLFSSGPIRELWPWHASYASNFLYAVHKPVPGDPFSHFWSLAVEEQFYLVWPFLVFFLRFSTLKWLILALIILAPLFRFGLGSFVPELYRPNYLPPACGDALGAGAYLAFASRHAGILTSAPSTIARRMGVLGMSGGIATAGLMGLYGRTHLLETAGHTFLVLFFGWLVFGAAQGFKGPLGRLLNRPELRFLGKISYGLYVFHHFFTFTNVRSLFGSLGVPVHWSDYFLVQVLTRLILTLLVATASWYLLEKPLNNLKRYFTLGKKLSGPHLPQPPPLAATPSI